MAHDLRQTRQEQTLRRWLDALPDSLFEHRPVLAITHVAARMSSGTLEGVEQRLVDAERWLPPRATMTHARRPSRRG